MLLQDKIGLKRNVDLAEELGELDELGYLNSRISSSGGRSDEVLPIIRKAQLAFNNLRHLWCQDDI